MQRVDGVVVLNQVRANLKRVGGSLLLLLLTLLLLLGHLLRDNNHRLIAVDGTVRVFEHLQIQFLHHCLRGFVERIAFNQH